MAPAQSKFYTDKTVTKPRGWIGTAKWIDHTSDALQSLIDDHACISSILTLGSDGEFLTIYKPLFADKDDANGDVDTNYYIVGSSSNKIPSESLAKASVSIMKPFIVVIKKEDIGPHGTNKVALPANYLLGTSFEGTTDEIVLLQVPSICPMPYGITVMGNIEDPAVKRALRSYPEASIWFDCVYAAFGNKEDVDKIIEAIPDDELDRFLPGYREQDINKNGPFCSVSPLCIDTLDPATDLHQKVMLVAEAFKTSSGTSTDNTTAPRDTSVPPSTSGAITDKTFLEMAKLMANPDHASKKKEDDLSKAILRNYLVCCEIDWRTGTRVGNLSECVLSPMVNEAFTYKGYGRSTYLKSNIESGMAPPKKNDFKALQNSMNQDRCFHSIAPASVTQLLKGIFEKRHVEDLTTDAVAFDMLTLARQNDKNKINLNTREEVARSLEFELDVPDAHRTKTKTTSPRTGNLESMNDVRSMCANISTFGSLLALPSGVPKHAVALTEIIQHLYWFSKVTDFVSWEEKYNPKQPFFYVCFFRIIDSISVSLANFA